MEYEYGEVFTYTMIIKGGIKVNQTLKNNTFYTMIFKHDKIIFKNQLNLSEVQVPLGADNSVRLSAAKNFSQADIVEVLGFKRNFIENQFYTYRLTTSRLKMFATIVFTKQNRLNTVYEVYFNRNDVADFFIEKDLTKVVNRLKALSKPKNDDLVLQNLFY